MGIFFLVLTMKINGKKSRKKTCRAADSWRDCVRMLNVVSLFCLFCIVFVTFHTLWNSMNNRCGWHAIFQKILLEGRKALLSFLCQFSFKGFWLRYSHFVLHWGFWPFWFKRCRLTMIFPLSSLQALAKFQSSHKFTTKSGIEQEDALLNESAAKESSLTLHIFELENETKQVSVTKEAPPHFRHFSSAFFF